MFCVVLVLVVLVLVGESWLMGGGDGFSLDVKVFLNFGLAFGACVFLF